MHDRIGQLSAHTDTVSLQKRLPCFGSTAGAAATCGERRASASRAATSAHPPACGGQAASTSRVLGPLGGVPPTGDRVRWWRRRAGWRLHRAAATGEGATRIAGARRHARSSPGYHLAARSNICVRHGRGRTAESFRLIRATGRSAGGGWRTAAASFTRRNIVETEPAPASTPSKRPGPAAPPAPESSADATCAMLARSASHGGGAARATAAPGSRRFWFAVAAPSAVWRACACAVLQNA